MENKIKFLEEFFDKGSNGLIDCFLDEVLEDAEKTKDKYPLQYDIIKKFYDDTKMKCFINGRNYGDETIAIIDGDKIYKLVISARYGNEVFYRGFTFEEASTDEQFKEAFGYYIDKVKENIKKYVDRTITERYQFLKEE